MLSRSALLPSKATRKVRQEPCVPCRVGYRAVRDSHAVRDTVPCGVPCRAGYPCHAGYHAGRDIGSRRAWFCCGSLADRAPVAAGAPSIMSYIWTVAKTSTPPVRPREAWPTRHARTHARTHHARRACIRASTHSNAQVRGCPLHYDAWHAAYMAHGRDRGTWQGHSVRGRFTASPTFA